MISYMSAFIATSPVGRSFTKMRNGPIRRLAASAIFDWVIPSALVMVVVAAAAWVAFAPK